MRIVDQVNLGRCAPSRKPAEAASAAASEAGAAGPLDLYRAEGAGCPTGPTCGPGAKGRLRQAQALGEQTAVALSPGPAGAPVAGELSNLRAGLCPFLSQFTQAPGADLSVLEALRAALQAKQLDPVEFFAGVTETYGPSLKLGESVLFESRPDVVQKILVQTDASRPDRDHFRKSPLQTEALGEIYGHSNLFVASDDPWQQRRDLMEPYFNGTAVFRPEVAAELDEVTATHLDRLPGCGQVDLGPVLREMTLDSGLRYMFSLHLDSAELHEAVQLFERAGRQVADSMLGRAPAPDPSLQAGMDAFVDRVLEGRKPGEERHDLLQTLLDGPVGQDAEALRHEVASMALLGHETTSNLIGWSLAELSRDPERIQAIRRQADQAQAQGLTGLDFIRAMSEARDAVRDSLRQHAPNYLLTREARHDLTIQTADGPLFIAEGTQILMSTRETNRQAEANHVGRSRLYSFGGGQRVCLGQVFARLEADKMVTELVRRFDLTPVNRDLPRPHSDFSSQPADSRFEIRRLTPQG